jgi:hypothetical protein
LADSVRYGLVFGGIGLAATLAIILAAANAPTCSMGLGILGPVFALQIGLAAAAGFATSRRVLQRGQSAFAGFGAAGVAGVASVILLGLTFAQGWPQACTEEMRSLGVLMVVVVALFAAPLVAAAGAGVGWLATLFLGATRPSHDINRSGSTTLRGRPADKRPH